MKLGNSETILKTVSDTIVDGKRVLKQYGEEIIGGNKKVVTNVEKTIYEEKPSFYNDGMGGTNVKTLSVEEVRDAFSDRFLGRRIVSSHERPVVNNNGHVYQPDKPFVVSKEVKKETADHGVQTTYGYGGVKIGKTSYTVNRAIDIASDISPAEFEKVTQEVTKLQKDGEYVCSLIRMYPIQFGGKGDAIYEGYKYNLDMLQKEQHKLIDDLVDKILKNEKYKDLPTEYSEKIKNDIYAESTWGGWEFNAETVDEAIKNIKKYEE